MDGKRVLEVINVYRVHFKNLGIPKNDFPHQQILSNKEWMLAHCHGMLDEMDKFVAEDRIGKAFRWLGFIQGCLWSAGHYTLEELKNHSRPNSAD